MTLTFESRVDEPSLPGGGGGGGTQIFSYICRLRPLIFDIWVQNFQFEFVCFVCFFFGGGGGSEK